MINEDVEIDGVGAVLGRRERSNAAREGREAIVGEDFDCEGEIGWVWIVGYVGFEIGVGDLGSGEEMERGVGERVESKESEGEEEEGEVFWFWGHLGLGFGEEFDLVLLYLHLRERERGMWKAFAGSSTSRRTKKRMKVLKSPVRLCVSHTLCVSGICETPLQGPSD